MDELDRVTAEKLKELIAATTAHRTLLKFIVREIQRTDPGFCDRVGGLVDTALGELLVEDGGPAPALADLRQHIRAILPPARNANSRMAQPKRTSLRKRFLDWLQAG